MRRRGNPSNPNLLRQRQLTDEPAKLIRDRIEILGCRNGVAGSLFHLFHPAKDLCHRAFGRLCSGLSGEASTFLDCLIGAHFPQQMLEGVEPLTCLCNVVGLARRDTTLN